MERGVGASASLTSRLDYGGRNTSPDRGFRRRSYSRSDWIRKILQQLGVLRHRDQIQRPYFLRIQSSPRSQSDWFRAAISGQFLESKANEIMLHEDDPDAVEYMLKQAYKIKPIQSEWYNDGYITGD
ncbi:hypothetical protein BU23DRAFT_653016 [Bimuria novae-zelandiae CBS 107.79]|uniref:BTB domain-containing protein n=1 Tax=Bimuria novae-zelandiae CBS 107.79 TaxID=1447943 RepID=A0A6A5V380_9PLEO|nr:hypothetical protein BU23DRAFT_653016 [Bimuria novae-zelandiae CBS 107.79]